MAKIYQKSFPDGKNAGFTLIELLVVVLIIGILAAIAVPKYQSVVDKARMSDYIQRAYGIKRAQEAYYLANGKYAADLRDLDVNYVEDCEPALARGNEWICGKDFFIHNMMPQGAYVGGAIEVFLCPDSTVGRITCSDKQLARIRIGFDLGDYVGDEVCIYRVRESTQRGKQLCATLGFENVIAE